MGCTTSKTEIQLGNTIPWYYMENGEKKDITLEELNRKREIFWNGDTDKQSEVWKQLRKCCNLVLNDNINDANELLTQLKMTVVSGELSLLQDSNGNVYKIEKLCYSNPVNVVNELVHDNNTMCSRNVKFRFRIGSSFLNEEREIIFVFDSSPEKQSEEIPPEHSPENHMYFHTYYFTNNLETLTDLGLRDLVLTTIRSFPEVKNGITVTNIRLFYMGRELNQNLPFIRNQIPFENVIVVLVQYNSFDC